MYFILLLLIIQYQNILDGKSIPHTLFIVLSSSPLISSLRVVFQGNKGLGGGLKAEKINCKHLTSTPES